MSDDLFNVGEMKELLSQLNAANLDRASHEAENSAMSKEMEASQRRYEEILKKHEHDND